MKASPTHFVPELKVEAARPASRQHVFYEFNYQALKADSTTPSSSAIRYCRLSRHQKWISVTSVGVFCTSKNSIGSGGCCLFVGRANFEDRREPFVTPLPLVPEIPPRASPSPGRPARPIVPLRLGSIVLACPIVLHCCCVAQGAEGDLETPDARPIGKGLCLAEREPAVPGGCGQRGKEGSLLSCQTALWAPRRDGPLLSNVYSTPRGDLNALLMS
ncbi:hypothetical protein E2C01_012679 [Portunus trituberculatus]|uniref:Uncharacterized protein n=1 Tax=Portunus trituberculatus TaxID=210409 RepID=A0A5B7DE99_PORTR|nr:hypothetical protein [Portunus trituberculatus]